MTQSLLQADGPALNLSTGRLCLDFANTADWHASAMPEEQLTNYEELVAWAERVGLIDAAQAERLRWCALNRPAQAARVRDRAVALREAIYHLFSATAAGRTPRRADVETLNKYLVRALAGPHLVASDAPSASFTLGWAETGDDLDGFLLPVVRSAAALLTSPELARVGECADDRGCGYLFYDETRNRSRRWCDMGSCGNRAKAKRHAGKQQEVGTPDTAKSSTKHDST